MIEDERAKTDMDEVKENERKSDAEKMKALRHDERLVSALDYIQHLMDVSAFPGGPNGTLETEVRRGLINLKSATESSGSSTRGVRFPTSSIGAGNEE